MTGAADEPVTQAANDGAALKVELLFREQAPRLLRYFRSRTGDGTGAPDMVQDTFLRFLGVADRDAIGNPAGYLQRIAQNLLFNRTRRHGREANYFVCAADDMVDFPQRPDQEDALHARDLLRLYEQAVVTMRPKTREIFLLSRRDGLTYQQIRALLGISLGTVEYHMMRAIEHMDQLMGDL